MNNQCGNAKKIYLNIQLNHISDKHQVKILSLVTNCVSNHVTNWFGCKLFWVPFARMRRSLTGSFAEQTACLVLHINECDYSEQNDLGCGKKTFEVKRFD